MKKRVISIICIMAMVMSLFSFSVFAIEQEESALDSCEVSEITIDASDIELQDEDLQLEAVDKTELSALIIKAQASNAEDVADEVSYGKFADALEAAVIVNDDAGATEAQVTEAYRNLSDAIDNLVYIADVGILTNNSFTTKDKEWYPELSDPESSFDFIKTDASYTYSLDSPEPILTADPESTKMFDGNIDNTAYGVNSGTADTGDTVITFDLGTSYYINGVDVFSMFIYLTAAKSTHQNMKGYQIEVSEDGSNYKSISYVNAKTQPAEGEKTSGLNYAICTGDGFPAVSCRFVRLTVGIAENSGRYNIGEVVIKGFKNPFSKDILFEKLKECYGVTPAVYNKDTYAVFDAAYKYAESVYWDETASGRTVYDAAESLEAAYKQLKMNGKIAILSNNNFQSESDRSQYKGLNLVETTGLSYKYLNKADGEEKDSEVDIVSQDKACTKLIGGNLLTYDTSCVMYGKWDSPSPANVLFDMGELCYITGVDEWDVVEGLNSEGKLVKEPSSVSGLIQIYTSVDGVNFELTSSFDNQRTDYTVSKQGYCVPQDFDATLARFVKVIVNKRAGAHQLKLSEIVIKGFKAGVKETNDYSLGLIDYKDENSTRIISLDGKNEVHAKGTVTSNLPYEKDAFVVTAAYDENGKMVGADVCKVPLKAFCGGEFECNLSLSGTAASVQTFVWSGLSDTIAQSVIKRFGSLK